MDSGTSSEQIWFDRMNEIVAKAGFAPQGTQIGAFNDNKSFDTTALASAVPYFEQQQYKVLFARAFEVDAAAIAAAGAQSDLQVQVWDRHYDTDLSDGALFVSEIANALAYTYTEAQQYGLALIPNHLMFAKLKTMRPSVQLLSDGTHVTYPVGYGLATMSVVSRTGIRPSTDGLDPDTQLAAQLGNETIRQLSALSISGGFVPDDPTKRPTAHLP
jgi:hypothetical protein